MNLPRVFFDADALFAGAASAGQGASLVLLQMGQWGLLACGTSEQVVVEAERNIARKLPARLPELRSIIQRALTVVSDPAPGDLTPYRGLADPKDLPILVAALQHGFPRLVSFNTRHYRPPASLITVQRPGDFLGEIRTALATLDRGPRSGGSAV
jgi:hypothetical protein